MIGKMVEWDFSCPPTLTGGAPVKGTGRCHHIAHESGDDTWQDFIVLVELDSGEFVSLPVTTHANLRICKES